MAFIFSDLHAESGLRKTYIFGESLTKDDVKVYAAVPSCPGGDFPNASKWYERISSHLTASFPGKAAGVRVGGGAPAAEVVPAGKTEVVVCVGYDFLSVLILGAPDDDDDDIDLFGEETEEKKASEEKAAAKKASTKKKESGKSSVLMDVKPWDEETDMKKLEEAVRSIEMPGLLWGASKLVPVGYGINKLQIMLAIVDDLVSVDALIEDYLIAEPANEYIQSCDIVAFNKI